jgi:hypothetical protein
MHTKTNNLFLVILLIFITGTRAHNRTPIYLAPIYLALRPCLGLPSGS